MESKKPWQSKTMVLNAVGGLLTFLALFLPTQMGVASQFLQAHAMEIGLVWSIANMVLRAVTKDKISLVD